MGKGAGADGDPKRGNDVYESHVQGRGCCGALGGDGDGVATGVADGQAEYSICESARIGSAV